MGAGRSENCVRVVYIWLFPDISRIPTGSRGFPGGSVVRNPSANARNQISAVGREDTLGKELATHSSILAWRIPWTEEPGGLQSMGSQKSRKRLSD